MHGLSETLTPIPGSRCSTGRDPDSSVLFCNSWIMLLQLSWSSPLPPPQHFPLSQATPPPLFTSMGHASKFFGYSISCTVHPHGYSVTTHLYFLIPSPPHPFSYPTPIGQPSKGSPQIHDSVSVLVCLICFLDSIVDRYVFLPFYCSLFWSFS